MGTEQHNNKAAAEAFIHRWQGVSASELSTAQRFVIQLCELLGVEAPHPTPEQAYMFERPITFNHGDGSASAGRIDCYKRGAFVLEAKKVKLGAHTKGFDDALLRVADVLGATPISLSEETLSAHFTGRGPWKKRLPQILHTLEALGRARQAEGTWRSA